MEKDVIDQDGIWPSEQVKKDFGAASAPDRMETSKEMARVVAFPADRGYTVA